MNLFLLLQAFGLGHDLHGEHLLPIGTVYDPFVCRGLDALIYALYSGARFVVVGTPAGITLAPEGGAHQSTITPSIGLELPGLTFAEPAYAEALDWLLCDGLARPRRGRRDVAVPAPVDPAGRPGTVRGRASSGSARSGCGRTCSPAGTGCASRRRAGGGRAAPRAGRSCPRCSPRPSARRRRRAGPRARPDQHRPAVPASGATGCAMRPARRRPAADRHHLARLHRRRRSGRGPS